MKLDRESVVIDSLIFTLVPIQQLLNPRHGFLMCIAEHYWYVTENTQGTPCVLLYGESSWQCNSNRAILERYPLTDCDIQWYPVMFLPHRCADYQ